MSPAYGLDVPGPEAALFAFEHVSLTFGDAVVLDDVDTTIAADGLTAVVGPSGSGKSTLLRLCNRLEVPTSGRVLCRGEDVASLDPLSLRRRVGMVFQRPTPFPGTVRDNLRVARLDVTDEAATKALEQSALDPSFLDRVTDDLSGGEAQRVCLARTLVTEPEVLLMDEPTSALDKQNALMLERLACDLAHGDVPVVWVSHDEQQVDRIADRRIVMEHGRVIDER
jgi:putative ABC transport system ATP-binding protein